MLVLHTIAETITGGRAIMIVRVPILAFVFCLATIPVSAQLAYSFDSVSPTSLKYNGIEYADSIIGGGIAAYRGTPWIQIYTRPDMSTYSSDYFSCPGIVMSISAKTVNGTCAAWAFHFSYTYSQPDTNTLKIVYTLYNDNSTDTMTKVQVPLAGIVVPHPYASYLDLSSGANLSPINGGTSQFISWPAAEDVTFTTDIKGWWAETSVLSSKPDSNHDDIQFLLQNQESSGQCAYSATTFCQEYTVAIAPSSSYTVSFFLRFAPTTTPRASLVPEVISAWNSAFPAALSWSDRRPIGQLILANNSDTSSTNPGGYFNDPTCECTNQTTFNARLSSYITNALGIVNAYGFPLQGFIIWDIEGQESAGLDYVGDPRSLPTLAPQMNSAADSMFSQLKALGYRVGVTIRAGTFNYGSSLPSTPCTNYAPTGISGVDAFFNPPFFLSVGTPTNRGYTCDKIGLRWVLGGTQAFWAQQADAATDIIAKATYAHSRWGATLFYIDSNGWYGSGQYAPEIWQTIQAALPDSLFIPEHNNSVQFPYASAYNDARLGAYNSAEAGFLTTYPYAFMVSFQNGTSTDPSIVSRIAAGMCHGDIYGVQAWYDSGEAVVLGQAMKSLNCGVGPSAPTGLAATVHL